MKTNLFLTAALSLSLCAASTAQTLPAYLPTDGLVGWWPFNGNANDESGNGNNGAVNGATLTTDRFGNVENAYGFDGVASFIEFPDSVLPSVNQSYSISFWALLNVDINRVESYTIFDDRDQTSYNSKGRFVVIGNNPNSYWYQMGDQTPCTSNELEISSWTLISCVYNNETNSLFLYKNGNLDCSTPCGDSDFHLGARKLWIGKGQAPGFESAEEWRGNIDDIAIYNRALTPEEITALYTGEPVNPPTACNPLPSNLQNGLVGYWPFCGNANDESGNGNDGTVNGATLTEDRFGVANAAYDFDGVNDFIELTENVLPANNNSYSIHFWAFLNKDTSRVESYTVFDDRDQNSFGSKGRFIVSSNTDETYSYQMGDNEACSNNNFQSNLWTSIACIYDNENDVITVYKDGNLSCTSSYGDDSFYPGLRKLLIGKGKSPAFSSVEEWKGQIDDIAIYNRALTPDEVQQLYTLNACTFTIYDTVTVTQTVYDTVSVSVSTTDTLIINTLITSVEPAQENTFLVYPNPAGSQITINNGNVGILGGYTLRITNSAGQEVYNQNITQAEVTLDLGNWGGNGLYVLYITDPQGEIIAVKQIVLQ